MKKRFGLLFIAIFLTFVFSASAQEQSAQEPEVVPQEEQRVSGEQKLSEFFEQKLSQEEKVQYGNNWFISAGFGASLLLGEQDSKKSVSERLKYGGEFVVGKWLNSNFGLRLQAARGTLRGYNTLAESVEGSYIYPSNERRKHFPMGYTGSNPDAYTPDSYELASWTKFEEKGLVDLVDGRVKGFWQQFTYTSATIDLMMNLTNLFRGYYRKGNLFDVIPFVGAGLIFADESLSNPDWYYGVVKVGARVNVNLTDIFSLYVEGQGSLTDRELDGYTGHSTWDAIANLTAGVQFTFNKGFTKDPAYILSLTEINYLNEKINDNRALIDNNQNVLERQQNLLDRLNESCDNIPAVVAAAAPVPEKKKYAPEYVRFKLDSYQIQYTEDRKIRDAVEFLYANPDSKLLLSGYADRKTGNPTYNLALSRKRVEAVRDEFLRRGIDSQRLILEWKGDIEQPYATNEWNRVVIMLERN
jgi:outer membrane protein OmpA-like peptidoglycan-associated protein